MVSAGLASIRDNLGAISERTSGAGASEAEGEDTMLTSSTPEPMQSFRRASIDKTNASRAGSRRGSITGGQD